MEATKREVVPRVAGKWSAAHLTTITQDWNRR